MRVTRALVIGVSLVLFLCSGTSAQQEESAVRFARRSDERGSVSAGVRGSFAPSLRNGRTAYGSPEGYGQVPARRPFGEVSVVDTVCFGIGTPETEYIFSYDSVARVTSELVRNQGYPTWEDNSYTTYTYDSHGNRTSFIAMDSADGGFLFGYRATYTYDSAGRLRAYALDSTMGGPWTPDSQTTYAYDSAGNVVSILGQLYWYGWSDTYLNSFAYDGNGNMISEVDRVTEILGVDWVEIASHYWTYDAHGHVLTELDTAWSFDPITQFGQELTFYTYDENGRLQSAKLEQWLSGWTNIDSTQYWYDGEGHELSYLSFDWFDTTWGKVDSARFTYDSGGNLIRATGFEWTGFTWLWHGSVDDVPIMPGLNVSFGGCDLWLKRSLLEVEGVKARPQVLPRKFSLSQNYPNPFNPTTLIRYSVPRASFVRISIYDILGQEVRSLVNETEPAGSYSVRVDGSNLPSGVYFYRLTTGTFSDVKRMVLLK